MNQLPLALEFWIPSWIFYIFLITTYIVLFVLLGYHSKKPVTRKTLLQNILIFAVVFIGLTAIFHGDITYTLMIIGFFVLGQIAIVLGAKNRQKQQQQQVPNL